MTETGEKNREAFLSLAKDVWGFDDNSMKFLEERTSDNWEPVPEWNNLVKKYGWEDQRIRIDIRMDDKDVQNIFIKEDKAYKMFQGYFKGAISKASTSYGCTINYSDFISNKVVFKKNITKIKKVIELIYKENPDVSKKDRSCSGYEELNDSDFIVKAMEKIGVEKKSSKDKLQFVISFNLCDWLLSSTAEKKFQSCFNLEHKNEGTNSYDSGYRFCLGLPFLGGDLNRAMLYTSSGEKKSYEGIEVDSVHARTWTILDKKDHFVNVKWYPIYNFTYKEIRLLLKNENFFDYAEGSYSEAEWHDERFNGGKYPLKMLTTKSGEFLSVYNDMGGLEFVNGNLVHSASVRGEGRHQTGQQSFFIDGNRLEENGRTSAYIGNSAFENFISNNRIGYHISNFKKLGINLNSFTPKLKCSCCGKETINYILPKPSGYANGYDGKHEVYCQKCRQEKIYVCSKCGETFFLKKDEKKIIVKNADGTESVVCPTCYEGMKNYICSFTGIYDYNTKIVSGTDKRICPSAAKELGYFLCKDTNEYSKKCYSVFDPLNDCVSYYYNKENIPTTEEPLISFGKEAELIITKIITSGLLYA